MYNCQTIYFRKPALFVLFDEMQLDACFLANEGNRRLRSNLFIAMIRLWQKRDISPDALTIQRQIAMIAQRFFPSQGRALMTELQTIDHLLQGDKLHDALKALGLPAFDMIDWQQTTDSTNDDCKLWANRGAVHALSISNQQRAGRGQSNRIWQSPTGNLYLSLLTTLTTPLDGRLALEVALALLNVPMLSNLNLSVKWPNDLYADGAKWGGILIEPIHSQNIASGAIIGVGVNLLPMQELVDDRKVTDLGVLLGSDFDRFQLTVEVIQALHQAVQTFEQNCPDLQARYLKVDALANKTIQITQPDQSLKHARAYGIADDGSLQIQTNLGMERLYGGQVSVVE
jgi:BirA family biotin operon repressor/biotin-[acetyl-CoA-carboxylase] ligase